MTLIIDAAAAATLLFGAAWLATTAMRRSSADLRRAVWRASFVGVSLMPLLASVPMPPAPLATTFAVSALPDVRTTLTASAAASSATPWLFVAWALGAGAMLLRLGAGIVQVRRWSRRVTGSGELRYSDELTVPCTWGAWRPEILLPSAMRNWPMASREVVLRHEAAHIAQHDWAWQIAARIIVALLWFHPLAWLALAAMCREAERSADDRVIAEGTNPADYAAELVRVARAARSCPVAGVAMASSSGLEARVRCVLDDTVRRTRCGRIVRAFVIAVAGALAVSAAAVMAPIAAQEGEEDPVYTLGRDIENPRVIREVRPEYPPEAMRAGIEGEVQLQLIINKDGRTSDVTVIKSLEASIDRAAVDAALQWRFAPARLKGEPVRVYAMLELNFRLK